MFKKTLLAVLIPPIALVAQLLLAQEAAKAPALRTDKLGTTEIVHSFGATLLAGQPSADDLAEAKRRGVKTVVSLREENEMDWDEPAKVKELGLTFQRYGFRAPETLTDDVFDKTLKLLADKSNSPVLLHCSSANRVGAIWLAHRVVNDGISVEDARSEAKTVGLRTPAFEEKALAYVRKRSAENKEVSVKTGINDGFLDPDLDVSEWLGRFEIESREVYASRERVLDILDIKPGMAVADVGAGTGFYSRLFSSAVGDTGWVYAVEISPRFLEHINRQSQADEVNNVTSVLGTDRSVRLPPNSIDMAFVCDTYHHFEYPQSTLASIHRALKPGGTLVVIDFERIPGKSREFILGHVRAGKEVFKKEIVDASFRFIDDVKVPAFQENYLLRFRKQ